MHLILETKLYSGAVYPNCPRVVRAGHYVELNIMAGSAHPIPNLDLWLNR